MAVDQEWRIERLERIIEIHVERFSQGVKTFRLQLLPGDGTEIETSHGTITVGVITDISHSMGRGGSSPSLPWTRVA